MSRANTLELADVLERIASAIEANPAPIIGQQITVSNDGRSGSVTGMSINVTSDGRNSGPVIGNYISVSNQGGRRLEEAKIIDELREAAKAVRSGSAPKSWVIGLLERAQTIGGRVLGAAVVAGATDLAKSGLN